MPLRPVGLVLVLCVLAASGAELSDSGVAAPQLVALSVYQAHRVLRRLGLRAAFQQVSADTTGPTEFHVVGQKPDSGTVLNPGDSVLVLFNSPHMLRYWNPAVVPLLGDFDNTAGFFKVQQPPEPLKGVQAEYPIELVKCSFSGDCEVEVLVDFDGSVLAARVTKSSGSQEADSSACDAALRASFTPARHYDAPVRVWFPLPFQFRYKEVRTPPLPEKPNPADIGP